MTDGRARFLPLLRSAIAQGSLLKLTLGRYRGSDPSLRNLFVRPVALQAGPRLAFLWRHKTKDVTKNHTAEEALALLEALIGTDFLSAHLFTPEQTAQLEFEEGGGSRLRLSAAQAAAAPPAANDRAKVRPIPAEAGWLQALGVTNERGRPREGMGDKFRQIQKFAELFGQLAAEAGLGSQNGLRVVDMGSGKGYLTFAVSALLGEGAKVVGVEGRPELAALCNRVAAEQGLASRLSFAAGTIAEAAPGPIDVLIALHACDTATDDALARGIAAGARLLIVAPCCQKELRPQLAAPPVLAGALRHGIFQERQAEFATDALRAQLLEWAGYRTKVFEFISVEHTPKNLMIAAIKGGPLHPESTAAAIREFARFYGIKRQALAAQLGFGL